MANMAKMANMKNINIAIFGSTNGTSITRLLEEYTNNNLIIQIFSIKFS